MTGRAALLAAPALGTRRLLLLAPASEDRLRQDGPGRAELDDPGFQARFQGPKRLYLLALCGFRLAEPGDLLVLSGVRLVLSGDLLVQRLDGPVPIAHRPEDRGQQGTFGKLGLQPFLLVGRLPQGMFQMEDAPRLRIDEGHLVVVSRQLPALQPGFERQLADCRLEVLQPFLLAAQPAGLPVQPTGLPAERTDFPAQRLDRVLLLACAFQRLAQLGAPALRGGEDFAARFNRRRSASTFLRNAAISSFCSCERSSALLSRAFSRVSWRISRVREATVPAQRRRRCPCRTSVPTRPWAA